MSATGKRPAQGQSPANRDRDSTLSGRGSTRASTPSSTGVSRSRSTRNNAQGTPVSARAAAKRPGVVPSRGSNLNGDQEQSNDSQDVTEEEERAETASLIEDLKARLEKAEKLSEEYQHQAQVLQSRLDDALGEQAKLEERVHENDERLESLESAQRESTRERREMEKIYEAERVAMTREKEDMANREEEMQTVIQRLKENLAQRDSKLSFEDDGRVSRSINNASPAGDNGQFAPSPGLSRSNSRNASKILLQKDRIIESLRLELAESQIKLVDAENSGGGRVQELEKQLLETRMTNARLMEDNESFQLLLSEKTLNGEFSKTDLMQMSAHTSQPDDSLRDASGTMSPSLADELEDASDEATVPRRKFEIEVKSLRDQNKALTLYVSNIIERLLQHKDFESILDKTPNLLAGPNAASARYTTIHEAEEKELPPTPSEESEGLQSMRGPSLLQRARSVAANATRPRPRPMSQAPPSSAGSNQGPPTVVTTKPESESFATSPPRDDTSIPTSVPLGRSQSVRAGGHRRTNSEWAPASVVNSMYRGPGPGSGAGSPGMASPRRTSFFGPGAGGPQPRVASSSSHPQLGTDRMSSSASTYSEHSSSAGGDLEPGSERSPPPSSTSASANAPIAGNKLRPLRLVEEITADAVVPEEELDAAAAARKAKRSTWMGWFNKGKPDEHPSGGTFAG